MNATLKRRLLLFALPPGVLAAALAFAFFDELDSWIPGDAKLATARAELARAEKAYHTASARQTEILELENVWKQRKTTFFATLRDGDPEFELRRKIEPAATAAQFNLTQLGTVRLNTINANLSFAEIDVAGSGEIGPVADFLRRIAEVKPALSWKKLDLRPGRARRGPGGAPGMSSLSEDTLQLGGTIRVIVYSGKIAKENAK